MSVVWCIVGSTTEQRGRQASTSQVTARHRIAAGDWPGLRFDSGLLHADKIRDERIIVSGHSFDASQYVTRTPGGNIGVRDTIRNDYFYEVQSYLGPAWAPDGFSPKQARKVAAELVRLADELEKEVRRPKIENWPPREGDVWEVNVGRTIRPDTTYKMYDFGKGGLQAKHKDRPGFESMVWTYAQVEDFVRDGSWAGAKLLFRP